MAENPASADAPEPESAPPTTEAPPTEPWWRRFPMRKLFWPSILLAQIALLAVLAYIWSRNSSSPEPDHTEAAPALRRLNAPQVARTVPNPPPRAEPADDLARADEIFRGTEYNVALTMYRRLSGTAGASMRDALKYRVALTFEATGQWAQALAEYRELTSQTTSARTAAAAHVAQARVFVRTLKPVEAKRILCDVLLRSGETALLNRPFLSDARYLLALASAQEVRQPRKSAVDHESVVSARASDWSLEPALEWVDGNNDEVALPSTTPSHGIMVQLDSASTEKALVRASAQHLPILQFVEQLASLSGLRAQWTAAARDIVSGRTVTVDTSNEKLGSVFHFLASRFDLIWSIEKDALILKTDREATEQELAYYRHRSAKLAIQDAVERLANHHLAALAFLEAGNLESDLGNASEAISWYERLIQEASHSPAQIEAHYNLGLAHARTGNLPAARKHCSTWWTEHPRMS